MTLLSRARSVMLAIPLMLPVLAGLAPAAEAADVQVVTSPGGLKAWLVEDHATPIIAAKAVFRGGASQDPPEKPGVAAFANWMFNEGAGNLRTNELIQRLNIDLAAEFGKLAHDEGHELALRTMTANRDEVFDLLRLMLVEPRFDEDSMARARADLAANADATRVNAGAQQAMALSRMMNGEHPFARFYTRESIAAIGKEDIIEYRRRVFAKDNLLVAVVGDIDAAALGALLDRTFGALPEKGDLIKVPALPATSPGVRVLDYDVPQATIMFGSRAELETLEHRVAADVVNEILGSGALTSRLMIELREKRGLVYGVSTVRGGTSVSDTLAGSAASDNDKVPEVLALIRHEMARLLAEGVGEEELSQAKSVLKGRRLIETRMSLDIAHRMVWNQFWGYGPGHLNGFGARVDAVTAADVRAVAKRYLKPDALAVVVVGKGVKL